jgi:hypothetical protein
MARKQSPQSGNIQYGIDQTTFTILWESSGDTDELVEKFRQYAEERQLPAMPKAIILARASAYRTAGVGLKKMERISTRSLDIKSLNAIIAKIRRGEAVQLPEATPPAAPPEVRQKQIASNMKKLVEGR